MKIGEKIQSLRKSSGMSQEVLAQKLNVNRNLLSRVETGKNDPDFSLVVNVSKIFNVDIASLADLDNKSLSYEDKIKEINDGCYYLTDNDLDLVIRMISVLKEEYVKRSLK